MPNTAEASFGPSTRASVGYATGTLGMSLFPMFLASWQLYYFSPPADSGRPIYVSLAAISLINLVGQVIHGLADGLIGHGSDRTRSRWGRRVPWIAVGSPVCYGAFVAIWWPPAQGESAANVAWLIALRAVFWIGYTAVYGPYSSLLAEISRGPKRLRIAVFMALFDVVATVLAAVGAGAIIDAFPGGLDLGVVHLTDGYKVAAALLGFVAFAGIWVALFSVKERPHDPSKEVAYGLVEAVAQTFRNPAFRPYAASFVAFRVALMAVIALLPYQVNVVLKIDDAEAAAGLLTAVIVVGSALLFPLVDFLARKHGKKRVMEWGFLAFAVVMVAASLVGKLPVGSPTAQAYGIYAFATFPVAALNVLSRPILADVIDHDETLTGYRREGMYNGVEGLVTKIAEGVGPVVAAGMFAWFGATRDDPLGVVLAGPAAAVFCLLGWWFFRRFPLTG